VSSAAAAAATTTTIAVETKEIAAPDVVCFSTCPVQYAVDIPISANVYVMSGKREEKKCREKPNHIQELAFHSILSWINRAISSIVCRVFVRYTNAKSPMALANNGGMGCTASMYEP
jgi:hypothetical protein